MLNHFKSTYIMFNPLKSLLFVASWSLPSTDPAASACFGASPTKKFRRASRKCPSLDAGVVPSHRPLGHLQQPGLQHVVLRAQRRLKISPNDGNFSGILLECGKCDETSKQLKKIMGFYTCPTDSQGATSEHVTSKASFGLCRL